MPGDTPESTTSAALMLLLPPFFTPSTPASRPANRQGRAGTETERMEPSWLPVHLPTHPPSPSSPGCVWLHPTREVGGQPWHFSARRGGRGWRPGRVGQAAHPHRPCHLHPPAPPANADGGCSTSTTMDSVSSEPSNGENGPTALLCHIQAPGIPLPLPPSAWRPAPWHHPLHLKARSDTVVQNVTQVFYKLIQTCKKVRVTF